MDGSKIVGMDMKLLVVGLASVVLAVVISVGVTRLTIGEPVAKWWCADNGTFCVRSERNCITADPNGSGAAIFSCHQQRLAFCGLEPGDPKVERAPSLMCDGDLARCEEVLGRPCIGVE